MNHDIPSDPGLFTAPFTELIHNVHQFGEHWSWRCGVVWSQASEGWQAGECRYDHVVDSWEQLLADASYHLMRWHGIFPARSTDESLQRS